eukprot:3721512-Rhodomonas_salina.1
MPNQLELCICTGLATQAKEGQLGFTDTPGRHFTQGSGDSTRDWRKHCPVPEAGGCRRTEGSPPRHARRQPPGCAGSSRSRAERPGFRARPAPRP